MAESSEILGKLSEVEVRARVVIRNLKRLLMGDSDKFRIRCWVMIRRVRISPKMVRRITSICDLGETDKANRVADVVLGPFRNYIANVSRSVYCGLAFYSE